MLIIPRSKNQSVVISDNIIVNVVEVDGDEVQLSIEYPEGVSVRTGETVAKKELAVEEPAAV
ncbi:carbon storage regulator [Planctomycetota bacterium]